MATETMEQPGATEKSFMDSAEFDAPLIEAMAATEKLRAEAAGEVPAPAPAPAAIAAVPDQKPKPDDKGKVGQGETGKPAADAEAIPEDIKSPAGRASWKTLKEAKANAERERDVLKAESGRLKAEMEEWKRTATTPAAKANLAENPEFLALKAEKEAKEKQLEEYSQQLRMIDVEQHPKFKAYFEGKINAQMEMAKDLGGDKLVAALQLPPGDYRKERIREIAAEMDGVDQGTLGTVLANLRVIEGERAREVAEAKANYNQILADQKQQAEQKRAATENVFKRVTADVRDKTNGLTVFQEREGDEEWNKGVQERLAIAQNAFAGKLEPEAAARAVYWAAAAPTFLVQLNGALEKNAALEKEIASLRAVAPNPGGARPNETDTPTPNGKTGLDAQMDAMAAAFQ